jgi:hypothetical protein
MIPGEVGDQPAGLLHDQRAGGHGEQGRHPLLWCATSCSAVRFTRYLKRGVGRKTQNKLELADAV